MVNSVDPILNSSVVLGSFLQQSTSADDILYAFLLGALRVKMSSTERRI